MRSRSAPHRTKVVAGDKLVADYHGSFAEEALVMMTEAAVRTGLLAGAEAGIVEVTVPADAEIDPAVALLVDGVDGILGDPVWSVAPVAGTRVELTPLGRYQVRLNEKVGPLAAMVGSAAEA